MTRLQLLTYTAFAVFMSAVLAWGLSAQTPRPATAQCVWSEHDYLSSSGSRWIYANPVTGEVMGDVFKLSWNPTWNVCRGNGSCLSDFVGIANAKRAIERDSQSKCSPKVEPNK